LIWVIGRLDDEGVVRELEIEALPAVRNVHAHAA
jgi:hypothetical protein